MKPKPRLSGWLLLLLLTVGLAMSLAGCGTKSVRVLRREGEFFIRPDGRVDVTETWEVRFRGGPFHRAFRSIPYTRLEGVTNWQIIEEGHPYHQVTDETQAGPYTFWVEDDTRQSQVVWFFPETRNATRTFILHYTLDGALWLGEEGDRFFYTFIEADRGYPIQEAQATVHLPASFAPTALETATFRGEEASDDEVTFPDGRTLVFRTRRLDSGEDWEIGVAWPHGAVQASPPAWQQEEMSRVIPEVYRTLLRLEADGRLRVTETWRLHFVAGPFTGYTRELPRKHLDRISDWQLSMDGESCSWGEEAPDQGCALSVTEERGWNNNWSETYNAVWHFPPTSDATHTFTLTYTVWGAVAQKKQDQLHLLLEDFTLPGWPTRRVEVGLALPSEELQSAAQITLLVDDEPADVTPSRQDDTWWFTWTPGDDLLGGDLALKASWPGELLALPTPAWQQAQQIELTTYYRTLLKVGLLSAPGILLVLALMGVLFVLEPPLWPWPWPRLQPPEAVPPALVGVLLDRRVLQRHLLATLWDLARRGYLRLEYSKAYRWQQLRAADWNLRPYERGVLYALFPRPEMKSCSLATAQERLADQWDDFVDLLETEALQRQRWFRWPWRRWTKLRRALNLVVTLWGFVFVGGCFALDPPANQQAIYYLWLIVLSGMVFVTWWLPRRLPPRTWAGWYAAFRWQRYRTALRWRRRAAMAQTSVDEVLAYAAAFGLGPRLVRRLRNRPPAAATESFAWVRLPSTDTAASYSTASAGSPTGHGREQPRVDLDAAAASIFTALNAVATEIFQALNAATAPGKPREFSSSSSSSGSSSGFGGSSSSGSSTFSGGSSSGGGSSGFG